MTDPVTLICRARRIWRLHKWREAPGGWRICFRCYVYQKGAHPWHDDGTPGPGRDQWETGGPYAPPERVD